MYSSDGSAFGFDVSDPGQGRGLTRPPVLLPPNHFRPLSTMSVMGAYSAHKEDGTVVAVGRLGTDAPLLGLVDRRT